MNWEKREGWAAQTLRGAWCSCCSNALVLTPTSANARPTGRLAARVRRSACRSPTTDQFALLFFPGYRDPVGRHAFLMEISRAATGAALAMAVSQTFFLAPSWPPGAKRRSSQPAFSELHRASMPELQTHGRPLHLCGSVVPSANGRPSHESTASDMPPRRAACVSTTARRYRAEHAS